MLSNSYHHIPFTQYRRLDDLSAAMQAALTDAGVEPADVVSCSYNCLGAGSWTYNGMIIYRERPEYRERRTAAAEVRLARAKAELRMQAESRNAGGIVKRLFGS